MNRHFIKKIQAQNILFIYGKEDREISSQLYRPDAPVLSASVGIDEIEQAIQQAQIVYLYDVDAGLRNDIMKLCVLHDKEFFCTLKLTDTFLQAKNIIKDYDMPVLHYGKRGIFGIQAGIKRIFDVLGSLLALIMLSPILAIVALCIKIEDHGPVIYRQTRCTLGGREFSIYKFRSMVTDAEKHTGAMLAAKKDARLTKVGRIIRNTKLDELPQLVNILKGDMSFVGPRPERPELIAQALKVVPEFVLRTKVKAGLTGYAQIKGNYNTSFLQKLKWDMIYIENYSLWLDFKVIVLTIPSILQGDNSEDHSKWEEGE